MATSSVLVFNSVPSDNLFEVSSDLSPQLGGNLDVNGSSIISTSNANINITPNGSGTVDVSNLTVNSAFTLPTSDGSANQVLQTDGSGSLSWATISSGGISDLVDDTTPQLGGDLDINGNDIVSTSNADINITPNGTGKVAIDNLRLDGNTISASTGALIIEPGSTQSVRISNGKFDIQDSSSNLNNLVFRVDSTTSSIATTTGDLQLAPNNANVLLSTGTDLVFEGDSNDAYETTLTVSDPTADRTITFADESGTVAMQGFAIAMGIALG